MVVEEPTILDEILLFVEDDAGIHACGVLDTGDDETIAPLDVDPEDERIGRDGTQARQPGRVTLVELVRLIRQVRGTADLRREFVAADQLGVEIR